MSNSADTPTRAQSGATAEERRYDGAEGPFTYAEFLEYYTYHGKLGLAPQKWLEAAPAPSAAAGPGGVDAERGSNDGDPDAANSSNGDDLNWIIDQTGHTPGSTSDNGTSLLDDILDSDCEDSAAPEVKAEASTTVMLQITHGETGAVPVEATSHFHSPHRFSLPPLTITLLTATAHYPSAHCQCSLSLFSLSPCSLPPLSIPLHRCSSVGLLPQSWTCMR